MAIDSKIWSTKYPVSGDKIIKPLEGLEIEIEDGKTLEIRITNALDLMEEITNETGIEK